MPAKGIIFDLKKYAIHDGPGIRTTVFFKGCPLRCWWCHNPESQKLAAETIVTTNRRKCLNLSYSETKEVVGREVSVDEVMQEIEKDVLFYDQSGGGVTVSGGEPLVQPDFLDALLTECIRQNIHTAVDTSGFATWDVFERICDKVRLFLYDLKLMDDEEHKKYTNVSNKRILENLRELGKRRANVIARIPIIPGITDSDKNLLELAIFLSSLKSIKEVNLLPYNRLGEKKYKRLNKLNKAEHLQVQSSQRMNELKSKFDSFRLNVKIGG